MIAIAMPSSRLPARKRTADKGENTRMRILTTATRHFARHGLSGARVDTIATDAGVNIRMVYHHFTSKEGLYLAVLDEAYLGLRQEELKLDYSALGACEGLLRFFDFVHDHFEAHPDLVALMTAENLQEAEYLRRSTQVATRSSPVLKLLSELLRRGEKSGEVRRGIDPLQLYMAMVALSYFHLSNAHTVAWIFRQDVRSPRWRAIQKRQARHMIACFLKPE